jgi:hypothetical protein
MGKVSFFSLWRHLWPASVFNLSFSTCRNCRKDVECPGKVRWVYLSACWSIFVRFSLS